MDIETTKRFNKQIQRMYTLAICNIICAVFGVVFNYYNFDINYSLFSIVMFINLVAVFCYQPNKIINNLNEGYGYKKGLEAIAKEAAVPAGKVLKSTSMLGCHETSLRELFLEDPIVTGLEGSPRISEKEVAE